MSDRPSGIDKALQLAALGSTKLEYTAKPTLKDKKDAWEYFKRAAKLMGNVVGLEEEDCFSTGPEPDPVPQKPAPGVPLNFDGEPKPQLPALDCNVIDVDVMPHESITTEDEFLALLDQLEDRGLVENAYCLADWKPHGKAWRAAWAVDPSATVRVLRSRLEGTPIIWTPPLAEEMGGAL